MSTDLFNYGEILERLGKLRGFKPGPDGDEALAEYLGISLGSMRTARSNNAVNFKRLISVCRNGDVDMHYLFFGND